MNECRNNQTIDQHYVPRLYLKNFSKLKGNGNKEKVLTTFYQFEGDVLKENIPVKSICYKNYFYGQDGEIEKNLSIKELEWAKAIQKLLNCNENDIDQEVVGKIKQFAIYQYCRTLAMYNYNKNMISEMLAEFIHPKVSSLSKETVRQIAEKRIADETTGADLISSCDELVREISDLDICVIRYNTAKNLLHQICQL